MTTLEFQLPKDVEYDAPIDLYYHKSFKHPEKAPYIVKCNDRLNRKRWECTCFDYMYRRKDRKEECKHIKRVRFIDEARMKIDKLMPQNKGLLHDP
jgi:hypothetical protein